MMENLTKQVARTLPAEGPDTKELLARVDAISAALLTPLTVSAAEQEQTRTKFLEDFSMLSSEDRAQTVRAIDVLVETMEKREAKEPGFNGSLLRRLLAQIRPVQALLRDGPESS